MKKNENLSFVLRLTVGILFGVLLGIVLGKAIVAIILRPTPVLLLDYPDKTTELLYQFKTQYGIEALSPAYIGKEKVQNLGWSYGEIEVVFEELGKLPPDFLDSNKSPLKIYFIKPVGTVGSVGGEYSEYYRTVWFYLPADYDYLQPSGETEAAIFGSRSGEIGSVVIHEFAHGYTASQPDLLREFTKVSGWEERDGQWIYRGEREMYHRVPSNSAEDFAISVSVAGYNPNFLPETTLRYFVKTYPMNKWDRFMNWVEENRPDLLENK